MPRRSKIFICYRAEDDALHAYRIYESLKARFGAERLAMEAEPLLQGDEGRGPSLELLRDCQAVLLLTGARWMNPPGDFTSIQDPDDFVARELREATRLNLPILPVFLDGASPPPTEDLPLGLRGVFDRPALQLRAAQRREDMVAVEVGARDLLDEKPARKGSRKTSFRRRARIRSLFTMVSLAAGFAGMLFWLQGVIAERRIDTQEARSVFALAIDKAEAERLQTVWRRDDAQPRPKVENSAEGPAAPVQEKPEDHTALRPQILRELHRLGAIGVDKKDVWSLEAEAELIAFQKRRGLRQDGAPSPATLAALRAAERFEDVLAKAGKAEALRECVSCPAMLRVPGGAFQMGSPETEPERSENEGPRRRVSLRAFAIGRTEVSFAEWDACAADGFCRPVPTGGARDNDTDRGWGRGERPVIEVSWSDVTGEGSQKPGFIAWLNSQVPGAPYRLPSEAEWEYAARAGSKSSFWWGSKISPAQANYNGSTRYRGGGAKGEYRRKTLPVSQFKPNAFGLYQVHGNVWEWVRDCWHGDYRGAPRDGSAWMGERGGDCLSAVLRGGAWYDAPGSLRSANRVRGRRAARDVNVGFRVARSLDLQE